MSDNDWQKVKVAFDDADGNRVEAVMWKLPKSPMVWAAYDPSFCVGIDTDVEGITVTPIRELPTGVGAVIQISSELAASDNLHHRLFTLDAQGWWHGDGDAYTETDVIDWQYEVLSEGIQIGDVK